MAGAVAAYAALALFAPEGGAWDTARACAYIALYLVCAAGLAARLRVIRKERRIWWPLVVGLAAAAGGWGYSLLVLPAGAVPPYPSIADALWLVVYASICLTVVLLGRDALRTSRRVWLDAAIVSSATAAVMVAVIFPLALRETSGSFAAVATNLAYPALDALAVALVVGLLGSRPSAINRQWLYVFAGVILLGAADVVYFWQTTHGTYAFGTILDLSWPVATTLLVLAAWETRSVPNQRRASMSAPVTAALVVVGVAVWEQFHYVHVAATVLSALALTLALTRLVFTVRENVALARLLERQSAELRAAMEERERTHWQLKKVREVLSICMDCDTVCPGEEWVGAVEYLKQSGLLLSHGYCPDCESRHGRVIDRESYR